MSSPHATGPMRRLERALGEVNPFLIAVVIGLFVLDLTCVLALSLPIGRLTACVAGPAARATALGKAPPPQPQLAAPPP